MAQAITTKYIGATNSKGARIKATCQAKSVTIPYDYEGNADSVHTKAAKALADKLGWRGSWAGGGLPDGKGNAYVMLPGVFGGSDLTFKV